MLEIKRLSFSARKQKINKIIIIAVPNGAGENYLRPRLLFSQSKNIKIHQRGPYCCKTPLEVFVKSIKPVALRA